MANQFLSLREAAVRVGRSAGTLRRYIKTGRLPAEKHQGKFGTEYRIRLQDLEQLQVERSSLPAPVDPAPPAAREWLDLLDRFVPVSVYSELAGKHERLLVEFGMLRAGRKDPTGEAAPDLKTVIDAKDREIRHLQARTEEDKDLLRQHLREAEQEVRDREAEIVLLQEKINRLEQQFLEISDSAPAAGTPHAAGSPVPGVAATSRDRVQIRQTVGRLRQFLEVCRQEMQTPRGS